MKKIITILLLLLPLLMMAETTTDRVTISAGTLQPGDKEVKFTISLEGSRLYTGYQMDITLPQGVELNIYKDKPDVTIYKSSGSIYPSTYDEREETTTFTHSITVTYGEVADRTIRVLCSSSENENFTAVSGKLLTVYLKAASYAKPGDITLALSNCKFATYDGTTQTTTGYIPEQTAIEGVTVGTNAIAPLSVSATAKWGTAMLPFTASLPDGVKAYSCSSSDDEYLILSPASRMEAFKPYILYSEAGFDGNLSGTVSAQDYPVTDIVTDGYLSASVAAQTLTEGYVLQRQNGEVQFYRVNSEKPVTVQPGKCWADIPQSLAAKTSLGFLIDSSTCVTPLSAETTDNTSFHTVSGMVVAPSHRGIYIHQGKKYRKQ